MLILRPLLQLDPLPPKGNQHLLLLLLISLVLHMSIHNKSYVDRDVASLGPRTLCNAAATAATGQDGHHVDHCGFQVFDDLLPSIDCESKY
jgi:hypothetical protein